MARFHYLFPLLAACVLPSYAHANGRFPSADQLVLDPSDPDHWVLRATFGILQSHDAGRSFGWLCEDAVGYIGDQDPALAVLGNGAILAGYARGLRASRESGCAWESPFSNTAQQNFLDATPDPSSAATALFLSHSLNASHQVQIFAVRDDPSTAEPLPLVLGDDFSPVTLEVAPSAPNRLYVTGILDDLSTVLLRSDDRGQSWERLPIEPHPGLPAYIAAVDPVDPDRLYLRLDGDTTDYLLLSEDAGASFSEAFSFNADMLGFALSPDGTQLAVGGPEAGLFLADTQSMSFVPSSSGLKYLTCLKWTEAHGLLACARESVDGMTLARSDDGNRFSPVFHLKDLKPLTCEASSSVGSVCPSVWPTVAKTLGIDSGSGSSASAGSGCSFAPAEAGSSPWGWAAAAALLSCSVRRRRSRAAAGCALRQ